MKQFRKTSKFGKRDFNRGDTRDRSTEKSYGRHEGRSDRSDGSSEKRGFGRPEMCEAICANCGKPCTVPFRPTGTKPVYCQTCFRQNDSFKSKSRDHFEHRGRSNDRFEKRPWSESKPAPSSDALDKINVKLDKIMRALNIE